MNEIEKAIQNLQDTFDQKTLLSARAMVTSINALRAQQWIPVTERLPTKEDADEKETVLGLTGTGEKIIISWYFAEFQTKSKNPLTHWRPLPEPPADDQCPDKEPDGTCKRLSDSEVKQPCIEGPCPYTAKEALADGKTN